MNALKSVDRTQRVKQSVITIDSMETFITRVPYGDMVTSVNIGRCAFLIFPIGAYIKKYETHNIGIQMKHKELTKTFMMISN